MSSPGYKAEREPKRSVLGVREHRKRSDNAVDGARSSFRAKPSMRRSWLQVTDAGLVAECEVDLYRASGSGGQKRNKTSSAVRLRHKASGVVAHSHDSRSQHTNRTTALQRLRENLALDVREPLPLDYGPSPELLDAIKRGPMGKNAKTRRAVPYLLALGELLDLLEAEEGAVGQVAKRLDVTTGSLTKLLTGDDRLARRVHELRRAFHKKPLR